MNKVVIFAPFWRHVGHVGNYRVDRFVRWLMAEGVYIVLVRAGSVTGQCQMPWGIELTVKDPLGLYRDEVSGNAPVKARKPNKLRRFLAYLLFNPDPGVIWARAAAKHSKILKEAVGARFVLSSSPPDSAHIGAAILAEKLRTKLVVDMRDGWLDEPLKPLLRKSKLQQWREGRLEKAVLLQADKIFVTSPVWKSLLNTRLPFTQDKIVILTNGYPPAGLFDLKQEETRLINETESIRLIHAGRFTGSRLSQKVGYLLEPLLLGLEGTHGVITLLGRLEDRDIDEVRLWQSRFESMNWQIEVKDAVSREQMMALLYKSDGLLLLSASQAAIPSKLFEYLTLRKPIFAATPQSSAVWKVNENHPQVFLSDYHSPEKSVVELFIAACGTTDNCYEIPSQYSEDELSKIFLEYILSE